jgi:undecaprenyl-phosphate 4-deoxy-4-formamido-L-arabinose transferase
MIVRELGQLGDLWSIFPAMPDDHEFEDGGEHTVAVVIPVYRGERTLDLLLKELLPFTEVSETGRGRSWRITEVVLVHDAAPDRSDVVIRRLASEYAFIHPVWLSRNFGQHAATLAGMSSTGSEWIATLDEDGQFDPSDIPCLLDTALDGGAQLVYAAPTNEAPHGHLRNVASTFAKWIARIMLTGNIPRFSSFRLMLGEVGRGVAAYAGRGVYLDVALTWMFGNIATCPVALRQEFDRPSGYSFRKLLSHFWQLVITAGTRPLRILSIVGAIVAMGGTVLAIFLSIEAGLGNIAVPGWTSLAVIILLLGGAILFALGVIAEYVGAAVSMAMGKPLYLIVSDPATGPLHRESQRETHQTTAE